MMISNQLFFALLFICSSLNYVTVAEGKSIEEFLELGDQRLASQDPQSAIKYYQQGLDSLNKEEYLLTIVLSLHVNLGTAYSSIGDERNAMNMYKKAILLYSDNVDNIEDQSTKKEVSDLAAQSSFFLGMTFQELEMFERAADAYSFANTLDENHWASLANLGSVLQDYLKNPGDALAAYNKAYELLTSKEIEVTDPPEEPRYVLSQLQYRIGLAITYADKQKCALHDNPSKEVPCSEMAANAFSYAIELDPTNENAKHMLASVTADATMQRASNTYVTQLFEDYASK